MLVLVAVAALLRAVAIAGYSGPAVEQTVFELTRPAIIYIRQGDRDVEVRLRKGSRISIEVPAVPKNPKGKVISPRDQV